MDKEAKHPGGRPTKYKKEFCKKVVDMMYGGASKYQVARELLVHVDTIAEWCRVYPEFSAAIKLGESYSRGWWEDKGHQNISNKNFNSGLWFMNMKNRHGYHNGEAEKPDNSEIFKQTLSFMKALAEKCQTPTPEKS